jgi:CBS domain-containing membrane protein
VTGYLALLVTGLSQAPPATQQGLTVPRIVAACLSLAVTALVLQILHLPHPPAGATTLLVSLGILTTPIQLLTIVLSVLLITIVMTMINKGRR